MGSDEKMRNEELNVRREVEIEKSRTMTEAIS